MNYRELFAAPKTGLYAEREIFAEAFGDIDMLLRGFHLHNYDGPLPKGDEINSVLASLEEILESPEYKRPFGREPTEGELAASEMLEDFAAMIRVALTRVDVRDRVRASLRDVKDAISAHSQVHRQSHEPFVDENPF